MSTAKCVLNDISDKYRSGLTVTNNDAVWLHDICLRLCNVINEREIYGYLYDAPDDLSTAICLLDQKYFDTEMPYARNLSKAREAFLTGNGDWHVVTANEMNNFITVFNSITRYVHDKCTLKTIKAMVEEQIDKSINIHCEKEVLLSLLGLRPFQYFKRSYRFLRDKEVKSCILDFKR